MKQIGNTIDLIWELNTLTALNFKFFEHLFDFMNFVTQLCAKLPILQDQCKTLVDEIIGYVDQNKAPEEICTLITVCPDPSL